jgi:hypothetical protein
MKTDEERFAAVYHLVEAAKDYWPKIPTPETFKCDLCDEQIEWTSEYMEHLQREHGL